MQDEIIVNDPTIKINIFEFAKLFKSLTASFNLALWVFQPSKWFFIFNDFFC